MSALLAKIMLAIFLLPSAAMVMTIAWFLAYEALGYSRDVMVQAIAGLCMWVFVAGYWLLLWRRAVRWTNRRRLRTLLAGGLAIILSAILSALLHPLDDDFAQFVFYATSVLAWLPLTVLVWRETADERRERLAGAASALTCPTCGYNLTGLTTARCPECGTQFTLDELVAGQQNREQAELQT